MSFISQLCNDSKQPSLLHPNGKGFSPELWSKKFEELQDGSMRDLQIYKLGLLVFDEFEWIRTALEAVEKRTPLLELNPIADRIATYLNGFYLKVNIDHARELVNREAVTTVELARARTFENSMGDHLAPLEVLEALCDSCKFVLSQVFSAGKFGVSNPSPKDALEPDNGLHEAIMLAQLYYAYEYFWQSTLWFGCEIKFEHSIPLTCYRDESQSKLARRSVIDLMRREELYTQKSHDFRDLPIDPRDFDEPWLAYSETVSKQLTVLPLKSFDVVDRDYAVKSSLTQLALIENNVRGLFAQRCTKLNGLVFGKVIHAWLQLSFLAYQLSKQATPRYFTSGVGISELAVGFLREELVKQLSQCLEISKDQGGALVDFFTFRGKRDHSFWTHPLIPRNNNETESLLPLWYPLIHSHDMRLMNEWIKTDKALKNAYSRRGHHFEDDASQQLFEAIDISPIQSRAFVLGPRIDILDNTIGDIDLILVVGNTAFVLECITIRHPAMPYEYWRAEQDLRQKISQVLRKRDYVKTNLCKLPDWLSPKFRNHHNKEILSAVSRVVGLVVSNSFLLEGEKTKEPYFCHFNTLSNILKGYSSFYDVGPTNGSTYRIQFFNNDDSVGDSMLTAIRYPPKAEFYNRCVTNKTSRLVYAKGRPHVFQQQWSIDIPTAGNLKDTLRECSFWSEIQIIRE
ncbi:MAG: hypothetical protein V3U75_07470 [Methylococcaceae bacterium]